MDFETGDWTRMTQIKVTKCPISGLFIIEPAVHGDARGYFMETYNRREMAEFGLNGFFVQDNQSLSAKGVLRGLHFQKQHLQEKLIRVIRGTVFDVAVDLRAGSETFGRWYGIELSEMNRKQLYISKGFAHGFLVLSDTAELCYKVTEFYCPGDEGGVAWNDPDIGIVWPGVADVYDGSASSAGYAMADGTPLNLSDADRKWPGIRDAFTF
jgi:dTDP-4-dehydrorhamnose 3,5-epimerase